MYYYKFMDNISVEKKWNKIWQESGLYKFDKNDTARKHYVLEMFSYPSGAKLHVGHWYNYALSDSSRASKKCRASTYSSLWASTASDCPPKLCDKDGYTPSGFHA